MRCLYCDKRIEKHTIYEIFFEEDLLCIDCRREMDFKKRSFKLNDLKVEYFYNYNSLFKSLLLQYKECYDEVLKDIFLYKIDVYLKIKYAGYKIIYAPSSKQKIEERGFKHLKLIFKPVHFKEVKGLKIKEEIVQEGKNLLQRQQIVNNFYYEGEKLDKVLIVDDVCTSGSTLLGIYNAIKADANKVSALVLAKV